MTTFCGRDWKWLFIGFLSLSLTTLSCRTVNDSTTKDELAAADDLWNKNGDMALLSDFIYQLKNPKKAGILSWGGTLEEDLIKIRYDLMEYDPNDGEWAIFVNHDSKNIALTFRGTNVTKFRDFPTNLDIRKVPFDPADPSKGKVSRGYLRRWMQLRKDVIDALGRTFKGLDNPNAYTINFTGHSLGGAVATIAGMDSYLKGLKIQLFSFSAPYFADEQFTKFLKQTVDSGMVTIAQEIDGDALIRSYPGVCPFNALNPITPNVALDGNKAPYMIYKPLPGMKDSHNLGHMRSNIMSAPVREKFQGAIKKVFPQPAGAKVMGLCRAF